MRNCNRANLCLSVTENTDVETGNKKLLAGAGDESDGLRGEAGAAVELERDEHVGLGADEDGEVVVGGSCSLPSLHKRRG